MIKIFLLFYITYFLSGFSVEKPENKIKDDNSINILAVGDINLGRKVGKRLLNKEYDYPFTFISDTLKKMDIVFANLESQLSDQGGETQHPKHNLVFTGPPEGSISLKRNNITIVSTANNHAFDYGKSAFFETIENLRKDSVLFCGTSKSEDSCYQPVIITKNNIRIAFFAVTDIVNIWKKDYKDLLALADSSKLFPEIRKVRPTVDLVILSYHGGNEYVDHPTKRTVNFAHDAIDAGVDLFIGHHPHVIQGIELYKDKMIFYSLGNFVFYQPQKYWTQKTFAVKFSYKKSNDKLEFQRFELWPAKAGLQPFFYKTGPDSSLVISRIKKLSPTIKWEN